MQSARCEAPDKTTVSVHVHSDLDCMQARFASRPETIGPLSASVDLADLVIHEYPDHLFTDNVSPLECDVSHSRISRTVAAQLWIFMNIRSTVLCR